MRKAQITDAEFPGIAFATLPNTGETIAIRHGERIYHRVYSARSVDELNFMYGVTSQQADAALTSALAGWKTPSTNHQTSTERGNSTKSANIRKLSSRHAQATRAAGISTAHITLSTARSAVEDNGSECALHSRRR